MYVVSTEGARMFATDELLPPNDAIFKIGDLAAALGVRTECIDRWIRQGLFPETCWWVEGRTTTGHRRRYTQAMIDAAVEIAAQMKLLGKRRWDLRESDYGLRVSQRWRRTEHHRQLAPVSWDGERGWPDANPLHVIDYTDPAAVERAKRVREAASKRSDDYVIDLSTPEANEANNAGRPIIIRSDSPEYRKLRRYAQRPSSRP
jgi:hypothetical protein